MVEKLRAVMACLEGMPEPIAVYVSRQDPPSIQLYAGDFMRHFTGQEVDSTAKGLTHLSVDVGDCVVHCVVHPTETVTTITLE